MVCYSSLIVPLNTPWSTSCMTSFPTTTNPKRKRSLPLAKISTSIQLLVSAFRGTQQAIQGHPPGHSGSPTRLFRDTHQTIQGHPTDYSGAPNRLFRGTQQAIFGKWHIHIQNNTLLQIYDLMLNVNILCFQISVPHLPFSWLCALCDTI